MSNNLLNNDRDQQRRSSRSSKSKSNLRRWWVRITEAPRVQPPDVATYNDRLALHQPDKGVPYQEWVKRTQRLGTEGLMMESRILKRDPLEQEATIQFKANKSKNRYPDVPCLDWSRVILRDRILDGNYIHANYVDGYKQQKAYICTQGPMKNTFIDFWRMVWQEKVLVIVMTTHLQEGDNEKCGQYWPPNSINHLRCGPFLITHKRCIRRETYTLSWLIVQHQLLQNEAERLIAHLQYHAWPDHNVPRCPAAVLHFLKRMHSVQAQLLEHRVVQWQGHVMGPPIVIHCSAGIGRTGTLCAIDICVQRLSDTRKIDTSHVIRKVRSQRKQSIQTVDQYIFMHLVIIHFLISANLLKVENLDVTRFLGKRKSLMV